MQFINDLTTHFEANHSDLLQAIGNGEPYKKGKTELYSKVVAAIKAYRASWTA